MNNEDFANAYLSYVQNEQSTMQLKSTLIPKIKFGETLDDYEIIKTIGKGSTGSVLKVISKNDGETYALKKIETKHLGKDNLHRLWKEVAALKELQHPHIIKYYHSFIDDNYLCIVTEFARHGDLDKVMNSNSSGSKNSTKKSAKFQNEMCGKYYGKWGLHCCTYMRIH